MFCIILKKKILSQAPKSDWYISDTRWWIRFWNLDYEPGGNLPLLQ